MKSSKLFTYLNSYFNIKNISDSALNGIQVEADHSDIKKIVFAVDFSLSAVEYAIKEKAQVLFVHHGIIWNGIRSVTGLTYSYLSALIKNNIALYSVHLPLDLHPEVGNNIGICKLLNLKKIAPFGYYKGSPIGFCGQLPKAVDINKLESNIKKQLNATTTPLFFGPKKIKTIGVVSGGAADCFIEAKQKELDLFLTGETSHSFYNQIKDSKANVLFCGHYATETIGLQQTARHLEKKFNLTCKWFDNPTGL